MESNHDIIMTTKKILIKYFDMKDMGIIDIILEIRSLKYLKDLF